MGGDSFFSRHHWCGELHIRQHIVEVALLGVDHPGEVRQLFVAVAFVMEAVEQLLPRARRTPECAKLVLILEQRREVAIQLLKKLRRRHRRPVGIPVTG